MQLTLDMIMQLTLDMIMQLTLDMKLKIVVLFINIKMDMLLIIQANLQKL